MSLKTLKQYETSIRHGFMIVSFLFAGIALLFFIYFLIMYINGGTPLGFSRYISVRPENTLNPMKVLSLVFFIFSGIASLLSFFSGILLLKSSQERVQEKVKEKIEEVFENHVQSDILLPDEKKLIEVLERNNDSMTQSDLVRESGLSKVKVHRVLKNLEAKKIITKYDFGMTNKIRLEKKVKEEKEKI